jgi:hypothetical protein
MATTSVCLTRPLADQHQPFRHRLAIAGLDVADLRGDTFICGGHERCLSGFRVSNG